MAWKRSDQVAVSSYSSQTVNTFELQLNFETTYFFEINDTSLEINEQSKDKTNPHMLTRRHRNAIKRKVENSVTGKKT